MTLTKTKVQEQISAALEVIEASEGPLDSKAIIRRVFLAQMAYSIDLELSKAKKELADLKARKV